MKPLIIITGPTACGKTPTAVALAKLANGEVVSADSMQIYRGMDIGTAKPGIEEREGIPHHMIDIADPSEDFSAATFQQMARAVIDDIYNRGKLPILAGGTGFYINSVIYEDALSPDSLDDMQIRTELMKQPDIYERLKKLDPKSAEAIHPNNIKRVARALAYCEANGSKFSDHKPEKRPLYDASFYVLHRDRALLYEAINNRVKLMIKRGLVEEVKTLLKLEKHGTAMQALGYKEMLPYLNGEQSLEEAIAAIQQGSRRYAKQQLTWFRHQLKGTWLSMDEYSPMEAARRIKHEELSRHGT